MEGKLTPKAQWLLAREAALEYERVLVPAILGPAARIVVARAAPRPGDVVVDVGCGTGAAAREAAARVGGLGRVIAVDVNPSMLQIARSLPRPRGAAIEWYEGSAYRLPVENGAASVVLCAQTLQLLTDRRAALAEAYRVLGPGGRLAVSVWCDPSESPYFQALVSAAARHLGDEATAGLKATFALPEASGLHTLIRQVGFRSVTVTKERFEVGLPDPSVFVAQHLGATPAAAAFATSPSELRQTLVEEVGSALGTYATDDGIRVPFVTHLALATR